MRSCNGFTCVYSTACAPRFQFSVVVVVSDACSETTCVHRRDELATLKRRASTPKRRPTNAALSSEKMLSIITRVSHVKLEKYFQFSKCEHRDETK